MKYNRELGKSIMKKYLGRDDLQKKLEHSDGVGEFAFKVAQRIKQKNPDLVLNPEFIGFLGYVHDIGYSVRQGKHELHTIDALMDNEGIPPEIARMTMHGQLAEQFGEEEGDIEKYLPVGIEGIILTYADMSIRTGEPMTVRERAREIIKRVWEVSTIPDSLKKDIIEGMHKALPRFKQYERMVLALADVSSANDF